jgi:hypothetical protein
MTLEELHTYIEMFMQAYPKARKKPVYLAGHPGEQGTELTQEDIVLPGERTDVSEKDALWIIV